MTEKSGGPIGFLPTGEDIERQRVLADFEIAELIVEEVIERAPQLNKASEGAETWKDRGLCRYPDDLIRDRVYYAPVSVRENRAQATTRLKLARRLCDVCPVKADCEPYALANGEDRGIWAGLSENQLRNQLKLQEKGQIEQSKSRHPSSLPHGS